jgi:tetratricopeptide (TPR) repeat protein
MTVDESARTMTAREARTRLPWRRLAALLVTALAGTAAVGCSSAAPPAVSATTGTFDSAVAAERVGDRALAVADFLAVVKADPRDKFAWYDLGDIADQSGQPTQAVADYRRVLAIDGGYVPALYNLAVIETPGAPSTAAQLYERALRVEPGDADAHLNLGYVLKSLGHTSTGDAQIATALRLDPALAARVAASPPTG